MSYEQTNERPRQSKAEVQSLSDSTFMPFALR
jgi:hypothetical protein